MVIFHIQEFLAAMSNEIFNFGHIDFISLPMESKNAITIDDYHIYDRCSEKMHFCGHRRKSKFYMSKR